VRHTSWAAVLALGLTAPACGSSRAELERLERAPGWVLTVDDLRARVTRLGREIGVATERVHVVATLRESPEDGTDSRRVARFGDVEGSSVVEVELVEPVALEVGRVYVLEGAVVSSPASPGRWMLLAAPVAIVDD
jgi:hypothetical protein